MAASRWLLVVVAACVVGIASAGWVKLLDNAAYGGTWDTEYTTLRGGSFTKLKAVHRSGFVACSTNAVVDGSPWQECNDGGSVSHISWEFAKNGQLIVTQPSWNVLDSRCTKPVTTTGDIVCDVGFDVAAGDQLTPSWFEAYRGTSVSDNHGTHYVDVYGWLDEGIDDLLLHWPANEGTGTALADAAASLPGTLSPAELWADGVLAFGAAGDTATTAGTVVPAATTSMSAWVFWAEKTWPAGSALPTAFGLGATGPGSSGTVGTSMYLTFPGGRPSVDFGDVRLTASAAMTTQAWHHVVMVQGAGTKSTSVELYLDGELVGVTLTNVLGVASPDAGVTLAPGTFALSPVPPAGAQYSTYWRGSVRDARVVGHAMRGGAVRALYQATRNTYVRDDALKLDGNVEYAKLPSAFVFGGTSLTIEAWVMCRTPDADGQAIVDMANSDGDSVIALRINDETHRLEYRVDNSATGGSLASISARDAFPRYRWTHVAITQSGSTVDMYIDGVWQSSSNSFAIPASMARNQGYIGRSSSPSVNTWNGYIDDVRLWLNARSEASIVSNMRSLDTTSTTGLAAWINFDPAPSSEAAINRIEALPASIADASGSDLTAALRCSIACVVPSPRPVARDGAVCGDGFRHASEMCDDGNMDSGDGCSAVCEQELGFTCLTDTPFAASVCTEGTLAFSDDADSDSTAVWQGVHTGTSGSAQNSKYYRRSGTMGLRTYVNGAGASSQSNGYTYLTSHPAALTEGTELRYHLAVHTDTRKQTSVGAIVRISQSTSTPSLWTSPSSAKTYTICYNAGILEPGYCDEFISVPQGVFVAHAVNAYDKLRLKYGFGASLPGEIVAQVGVYSTTQAIQAFWDNIDIVVKANAGTCARVDAVSRPFMNSCYEHLLYDVSQGITPVSGPRTIDRGDGPFSVYCDMQTEGGGWDVVSVMRSSYMYFGNSRCTSLSSTCHGNINARPGVPDAVLGGRSDAEVLIKSLDHASLYTVLSGFSTNFNGDGVVATFMNQRHAVTTSDSCSIGSGSASGTRHYCGSKAESNLQITAYSGYTPHELRAGLYTWVRLGGWWIGDRSGGGSGHNHQTDTSYGSPAARFSQSPYISASNYAMFYRSKSMARGDAGGSAVQRDGAVVSDVTSDGLSLVSYDETTAASTVTKRTFTLGDTTEEAALLSWLTSVPTGHVVAGVVRGAFKHPTSGNEASVRSAFDNLGVSFPPANSPTTYGWSFVGRKGFPDGPGASSRYGPVNYGELQAFRLFQCSHTAVSLPENALAGTAAMAAVRESGSAIRANLNVAAGGDAAGPITADSNTGQILLNSGYLDRESQASYELNLRAQRKLYESGWFEFRSGQGADSYRQLTHNLNVDPARMRVDVLLKAVDGGNEGFTFLGMGAAQQSDSRSNSFYGGLVFGYDYNSVRIWAPSINNGNSGGSLINIGHGWGNEAYAQESSVGSVNIRVYEDSEPDFDSGYFEFKSQQGASSFKRVAHALGVYPGRVKVMVQAQDGNNAGFVFEGMGSGQTDDDYGEYGGLVFGYDDDNVWMWAPDRSNNQASGYIVNVGDGWAGDHMYQRSHTAQVRILAWRPSTPDFESDWSELVADHFQSFLAVPLPADLKPRTVQVQIKTTTGPTDGVYFESMGMAQETGYERWNHYGGVVSAFSDEEVRMWVGSRDPRNSAYPSYAKVIAAVDGWGGEQHRPNEGTGLARVRAWSSVKPTTDDGATVLVHITDVAEPPLLADVTVDVPENAEVGDVFGAGVFGATDEDAGSVLTYRVLSGDPKGIFTVTNDGELSLAKAEMLDFDEQASYTLMIEVADGVHRDVGVVVANIRDVNNPPVIVGATFGVLEESPVNTLVGSEPVASDADQSDTILFSLTGGNVDDAFKVAACGGQIRVARDVLDYEGSTREYTLNITVTDDGEPSLSSWALFTVLVENQNDAPTCTHVTVDADEGLPIGAAVSAPGLGEASDPDGDDLEWTLLYGDVDGAFALDAATGALTMRNNVTNYEMRPSYTLRVKVADTGHQENLECEFNAVVNIGNVNDAPVIPPRQVLTISEAATAGAVVGVAKATDEDVGDTQTFSADPRTPTATSDRFAVAADGTITVKSGAMLDFETTSSYLLYLAVTDGGGPQGAGFEATTVLQVPISVIDANDLPVFTNAVTEFNVPESAAEGTQVVVLTATDEDDAVTETPLAFSIISQSPTDAFDVDAQTGAVLVAADAGFDFESGIVVYNVTVGVTDSAGATTELDLTFNIEDANDAPVITCVPATAPYWYLHPGKDALVGLVSEPAAVDGTTTFYYGDTFGDDVAACRAACEADAQCDAYTLYTTSFYEAAFQGQCYGRSASVGGLTTRGSADVVASGVKQALCDRLAVTENVALATVASNAPLAATDQDGNAVTFAVTGGNVGGAFEVDGSNDIVTAAGIDYETTNEYLLTVTATDNGSPAAMSSSMFLVTVANVNEPPMLPNATLNVKKASSVGEDVGPALRAVDPEGLAVVHTLTDGSVTAGPGDAVNSGNINTLFNIDGPTGQITVADATHFDTFNENTVLSVTVVATDTSPDAKATTTEFVVDVLEGNSAPAIPAGQSFSIPELSAADALVGTLVATDEEDNELTFYMRESSTPGLLTSFWMRERDGVIRVEAGGQLDHETTPTFTAVAEVRDHNPAFGSRTSTRAFTIVVTDVDEPPVCLDTTLTVPELSAVSTVVANGVACVDPDQRGGNPDTLTYSITDGNEDGAFAIARTTDKYQQWTLTVADGTQLDYETQLWHNLTVSVVDSDGLTDSFRVDVRVTDVREAPVLDASPAMVTLFEDIPAGTAVHDFTAVDPDADRMYWTLALTLDSEYFEMDGSVLRTAIALDYEAVQSYNATITVVDRPPNVDGDFPSDALFDSVELYIVIANVNDLTVSAVSLTQFATAGSEDVVFTGTNFGFVQPDTPAVVTATYTQPGQGGTSYDATGCEVTGGSNTQVTCTTVAGVGAGHVWTITVNGESVVVGTTTSYIAPAITSLVQNDDSATSGGEDVVLTGTNLGNDGARISGVYGRELQYAAASCVVTTPHTVITCKTVPGAGALLQWQLTVGGQASAWSGSLYTTSYAKATVASITAPQLTTAGGEAVRVVGTNFGPGANQFATTTQNTHHIVTAEYGDNAGDGLWYKAACNVLTPHTTIECTSVPGVGANLKWRVTVGGVTGLLSSVTTSYKAPKVLLIRDSEGAVGASTQGGSVVTLEGSDFGPATPTGGRMAQFGATYGVSGASKADWYTGASCAVTVPHRTITCLTAVGTGSGFSWVVRVGDQPSEEFLPSFRGGLVVGTSYASPIISEFKTDTIGKDVQSYNTEGGEVVRVVGKNFGVDASAIESVLYYAPAADATFTVDTASCSITEPHEEITCMTAIGAGGELEWKIVISGQTSSNPVTAYGMPEITAIEGAAVSAAQTDGGDAITLRGVNFGPLAADGGPFIDSISYGPTGTEYVLPPANYELVSHTEISVTTIAGVGRDLSFIVTVAGQSSLPSEAKLSYADPVITSVTPDVLSTNSPASSPTAITVTGTNFGLLDSSAFVTVMFGNPGDETLVGPLEVLSRSPRWEDNPTSADHTPGSPHTITFGLPASLGVNRAVVLRVNSRASSSYRASDAAFVTFTTPFLDYVEVSNVAPLPAEPSEEAQAESDFVAAAFPDVSLGQVRRLKINGRNFGPCQSCRSDGGADAVERSVLIQVLDEALNANGNEYLTTNGHVFSWDHEAIVLFSTVRYGSVKLAIASRSYDATPAVLEQESRSVKFVDFSPKISALAGATTTFNTKGGEILEMEVLHLLTTTELAIRVNNVSCPLVDAAGEDVAPADVYDTIIRKPPGTEITTDTTWRLRCRIPAGQGSGVYAVVYRDGQRSDGFGVDYHAPVVDSVSVVPAGFTHSQPSLVTDNAVKVTADTVGDEMRLAGRDFGICPVVHFGKDMDLTENGVSGSFAAVVFCGPDATLGAVETADHTQLTLPLPAGVGVDIDVLVLAGNQFQSQSVGLDFNPPVVAGLAVSPPDVYNGKPAGPTAGVTSAGAPVTVTLTGKNFGINSAAFGFNFLNVWMGRDDTETGMGMFMTANAVRDAADPHHTLHFELPAGSGADIGVVVEVPGHKVAAPALFNYRAPSFDSAPPAVTRPDAVDLDLPTDDPHATALRRLAATPASASAQHDGPTNGGTIVVINGDNLGGLNSSHCLFSMWANSQHQPSELTCDGVEQFPGEGEIPFENIVSATHEQIVFRMPPGMGQRMIYLQLRGVVSTNGVPFRYDDPELKMMTPKNGTTEGGTEVTLYGLSLGHPSFSGVAQLAVHFHTKTCVVGGTECAVVEHDHNMVKFLHPTGLGVDRAVYMSIVDRNASSYSVRTAALNFTYNAPSISFIVPNVADARGDSIRVRGVNFGRTEDAETPQEKVVAVVVNDLPCANVQRVERFGEPALECNMQTDVVGPKNVTITVAGQNGFLSAKQGVFFSECTANYYGQEGELCLPCPMGATCEGGFEEPRATAGWYNLNGTTQDSGRCHELRSERTTCNYVVPCEPKEACIGNNMCAVGYKSKEPTLRCADCDDGYYRRAGECIECPDNPLLLVIGFLCAAVGLCIAGYIMNKKSVNLAFLSIGVDYFQVLAMFANSKVQWPAMIKELFHMFSVFNLNLEITAPECSIPDLGYELKWFFAESLPLAAATLFVALYAFLYLRKRCFLGRKRNLHRHASVLIAMLLVMFYYLYLYLTRTTLDVFNCAPTDPPDGKTYLEVVFEECGVPGGLQMRLLPFAICTLLFYTLGYPSLVGYLLYKNRKAIMEDQLLRAQGLGSSRLENPNGYSIRKRYHKLYYHFRPDFWFWLLVIILRKFGIAFTALMFNKNPAFQLSIALLIMFACYAAQVRFQPYMSMSERRAVLDHHYAEVKKGNAVHVALAASLSSISARGKKKTRRQISWGDGLGKRNKAAGAAVEYFFNYNTVEQVLLACAVLVNLAGVMFESNRFQSEYYQQQRDIVTIFVLLVIFFSILYFCVVFISEVYTTMYPENCFTRRAEKAGKIKKASRFDTTKANPMLQMANQQGPRSRRGSFVSSGVNPMFVKQQQEQDDLSRLMGDKLPSTEEWVRVKNKVAELQSELRDMADANRDLKQRAQASGDAPKPQRAAPKRKGRARREFQATRAGTSRSRRGRAPAAAAAGATDAAEE